MRTVGFPEERLTLREPVVVTVGTYDGVHLGHQAILQRLIGVGGTSVCMTFSNHPASVVQPDRFCCLLSSAAYKCALLERFGVALVILVPFTRAFSEQEADLFLGQLQQRLGMAHLVLGHDALLGRGRRGTQEVVRACGERLGFGVEYVEALKVDGHIVSSSRIRQALREGDLKLATLLLGRPMSYLGRVERGSGKGELLRTPTANIDVEGLCIPPFGVYAAQILFGAHKFAGVANLGVAPTLHADRKAALEVHLFDFEGDLYDKEIEVQLLSFIRPERHFESAAALRDQIQTDVAKARSLMVSYRGAGA